MAPNPARKAEISPRERILAAARQLFYARGTKSVSVDEIAAAAHTNKMTLYRHFSSKDLLVTEYLRGLSAEADAAWNDIVRAHPGDPLAQLQAMIACLGEALTKSGARGCAVANAAVEITEKDHPGRAVIEAHKRHQREQLARLCREAGLVEPGRLADEIFLLLEGACINVQSVGCAGPGGRLTEMAKSLISRHAGTPG